MKFSFFKINLVKNTRKQKIYLLNTVAEYKPDPIPIRKNTKQHILTIRHVLVSFDAADEQKKFSLNFNDKNGNIFLTTHLLPSLEIILLTFY